jgi:hypothetical protein
VLLDATGHCPNLSAPEETIAAISPFIRDDARDGGQDTADTAPDTAGDAAPDAARAGG